MLRIGGADHDRSVPRQYCGGLSRGGRLLLRTQTANDSEWRRPWRGRTREARGRPSVAARCTRGYRWCLSAWGHWERGGASSCRWAVIAPPPASPDGGSRCARAWPPRNGQRARRPGHQTASAAGTPPAALGPAGFAGASGAAAQGPALAGDAARSSRGGRAAHHTHRTVRPGRSGPPHARRPWGSRVSFGLGSWWAPGGRRRLRDGGGSCLWRLMSHPGAPRGALGTRVGVGPHVGHDTVTQGSPPGRSRPRPAAQRVRPMRGVGSLAKAARQTGEGGVPGCGDHQGIGEAEPRLPVWRGQRQGQPTHQGQACGRMLYHELAQGDILSGGRGGLALLASTDLLLCSIWARHRIRQTPR